MAWEQGRILTDWATGFLILILGSQDESVDLNAVNPSLLVATSDELDSMPTTDAEWDAFGARPRIDLGCGTRAPGFPPSSEPSYLTPAELQDIRSNTEEARRVLLGIDLSEARKEYYQRQDDQQQACARQQNAIERANEIWRKRQRNCPKCGNAFVSIGNRGQCPMCYHIFLASHPGGDPSW